MCCGRVILNSDNFNAQKRMTLLGLLLSRNKTPKAQTFVGDNIDGCIRRHGLKNTCVVSGIVVGS